MKAYFYPLLILLIVFLLPVNQSQAQDTCLNIINMQVDSIGDENEKLSFKLWIIVSVDTIKLVPTKTSNMIITAFKILEKRCNYDAGYLVGKNSYKLKLIEEDKFPAFNIIFDHRGRKYAELLYDNSEKRIFSISAINQ